MQFIHRNIYLYVMIVNCMWPRTVSERSSAVVKPMRYNVSFLHTLSDWRYIYDVTLWHLKVTEIIFINSVHTWQKACTISITKTNPLISLLMLLKENNRSFLKGFDSGIWHSGLLCFWTLCITSYSKWIWYFENCYPLQVKGWG
jgi:hypothetical protein